VTSRSSLGQDTIQSSLFITHTQETESKWTVQLPTSRLYSVCMAMVQTLIFSGYVTNKKKNQELQDENDY